MLKHSYVVVMTIISVLFLCEFFVPDLSPRSLSARLIQHKSFNNYSLVKKNQQDNSVHNQTDTSRNDAYLVNTPYCQIKSWPLFLPDVIPLFKNRTKDTIKCGKRHNIRILRKDFNGIAIENPLNKTLKCFARSIKRKNKSDNGIYLTSEVELNLNKTNYFKHDIAVKVNCTSTKDKIKYERVVPLIPELITNTTEEIDDKLPNILLLGIDSVSRLNFERHFPLAKDLISKHDFYTMYGYNKVADNTFPNLTPFLTGFYAEDIWIYKNTFDYFPFIWKDYKQAGYQTYYMEDSPKINTYNYHRKGFLDPPTDIYLRPFFLAMDSKTRNDCYLDEPEVKVYYEYLYDFIKSMTNRRQKYLALHFMARLTHNIFNSAGLMDPFVTQLLKRLFSDNLMTNTVLVFFSDHGIRFGPIRQTMSGSHEERLPFMHIFVPKELRNENLTLNQNRLTSPFDIHATLKHIINGKPDYSLKYGKSLFEEIPVERSCKSIPISDHWCGCQTYEPINNMTSMEPISEFIVKEVNRLLSKDKEKCLPLSLSKTLSASQQKMSAKILENSSVKSHSIHYLLTLEVNPSKALFEASVNYNTDSKEMSIIGDISRINLYGNQSNCIQNPVLKKYCFCGDIQINNYK